MGGVSATMLAKLTATVLYNDKFKKTVCWVIVAVFSPVIVVITLLCSVLGGTTQHNSNAIDIAFNGGIISQDVPQEYLVYIQDIQYSFALLNFDIANINVKTEDENSLDDVKIKAVFYALFFGVEQPSLIGTLKFADCFVTYEERTRTVEVEEWQMIEPPKPVEDSEDGEMTEAVYGWVTVEKEEKYIAAVPIKDMSIVYSNIQNSMGFTITLEQKSNATEIYYRVKYGVPAPTYGEDFDEFIGSIPPLDVPFVGIDGFCSPVGANWRSVVSSEFGERHDPITHLIKKHNGIDFALGEGSPIYSSLDGTVTLVRYSTTGYGYHLMVDHGGGFVTMYAHCSQILVSEGQSVTAGQHIGKVGSTGKSTGSHLHFETIVNGEKQNPRGYLP